MTSRTPIRLTPHRGPLATPSTSPESSPTSSTPPSDISSYFSAITPGLDVTILQEKISTLSPPTQDQCRSLLHHQGYTENVISRPGIQLRLMFESLASSACELMNGLARIVTFCLLIWGLLEWSSHTSSLSRQQDHRISITRFPLPSRTRTLPFRIHPSIYEPRDQHVAILEFLSAQVQHAKALSTLSISLGLPLRAFFEAHRGTITRIILQQNLSPPPRLQEIDILANLTEVLHPSLLDFSYDSFIGRSFALALDELGGLISESAISHSSSLGDARLHAIYWRTTSNLLLEYSAALSRARRLLQHVRALHQQLMSIVSELHAAESTPGGSNVLWRKDILRHPSTTTDGGMQGFVTGLEVTTDNLQQLIAYLDWMTDHLAQTTLKGALKKHSTTSFSSSLMSLQELFAQSRPPASKKFCFCWNDQGFMSPRRVNVMVPGSPTVRAGR